MKGEYMPHTRGKRRFLPVRPGYAHMIKGTMAEEVRWVPLRWLGMNTGFYGTARPLHLVVRGRRIW